MSEISKKIFNGANHYVTSPYGKRKTISTSSGNTASFHYGTDYGTNGKKIAQYAIEDGYVFAAQRAKDSALYVWVIYPRIKKAFLHYHLDSYKVRAGQSVKSGTLLGYTGKTGKATGVHLHLGIRDLTRLNDNQIKHMTWALLQSCAYIDPEKLYYTAPSASVSKPTQTGSASYYPKYTGKSVSLVDALKSLKIDSSFANRKKIAAKNSIKAYLGTAKQNTQMLTLLKQGRLKK